MVTSSFSYTFALLLQHALIVPFLCVGLYALYTRLWKNEEFSLYTELGLTLFVIVFLVVEIGIIRTYVERLTPYYIFTLLGLFTATAALYGPIFVSLLAKLIVGAFWMSEHRDLHEPRFGPAEALERIGDYEGALREYLVLARMFPNHPQVYARMADAYIHLGQPDVAAQWLERAIARAQQAETARSWIFRLCDLYENTLQAHEAASMCVQQFIARFPNHSIADQLRERLARRTGPCRTMDLSEETSLRHSASDEDTATFSPASDSYALTPLSEAPLSDATGQGPAQAPVAKPTRKEPPTSTSELEPL
jgi:tetratricopeptide (TPR) repeat protein